jgi:hypothetical protein
MWQGKLFFSEAERVTLLGLLLENVGADRAVPQDSRSSRVSQRLRALVLAAFFAAAFRFAGPRRRAEDFACLASARGDAALRPSRLSLLSIARERRTDTFFFRPLFAFLVSRAATLRVLSDTVPFLGVPSFTPARRAFDSPMAIACWVELAPCFPSRM